MPLVPEPGACVGCGTAITGTVTTTPAAGIQRSKSTTRQTTATTLNIPVGRQSYTITVIAAASAASPTLDGVALPVGYTATFSVVYGRDTLPAAAIATVVGDDVIILQVF